MSMTFGSSSVSGAQPLVSLQLEDLGILALTEAGIYSSLGGFELNVAISSFSYATWLAAQMSALIPKPDSGGPNVPYGSPWSDWDPSGTARIL